MKRENERGRWGEVVREREWRERKRRERERE